jgi:acetyltransferase-like isoleucine patch superfamily enzyme
MTEIIRDQLGNEKKKYKIQDSISGKKTSNSKIKRYQELVIGTDSLMDLIKYELIVFFTCWIPGAAGIFLRSKLYPYLIGEVGKNVVFGCNVVLRHACKISIGDNVVIDDNVLIDAKGEKNTGITLKEGVFIGRNSILSCKDGDIELDEHANIGFNCEIFSSNRVKIGKNSLIAAYSYIIGGGNYGLNPKIPINQQYDSHGKGGVNLEENVWAGAHCVILDGVTVGQGSVIAAGAVVAKNIEPMSIAAGVPATIIKKREE